MLPRCVIAIVLLSITSLGCRTPWTEQPTALPVSAAVVESAVPAPIEQTAINSAEPDGGHEAALAKILDELTVLGTLSEDEKSELMADLREADPDFWPLIVKQYRSALAYKKQLAEREQLAARKQTFPAPSETHTVPQPQQPATQFQTVATQTPTVPVSFAVEQVAQQVAQPPTASVTATPVTNQLVAPLTPVATDTAYQPTLQPSVQPASYNQVDQPLTWQAHLDAAIEGLQAEAPTIPASTEEVNQHMRLRLLQLLAGDEDASMQSIPGATAAQQDYWNKQLFAVATYLDSIRQPDNKRRAAGALMHLDQARAKLAELATMQVRNLTFVDSVSGYGSYVVHDEAQFHPGDEVMLYAELENFSSQSTKEGHRTLLSTSYEVVDKHNQRVDSAQFPEVEDLCRNPRRDFHLQYTVPLPTRIYPGEYLLKLTITDQLSNKLGQASLPFTIVE